MVASPFSASISATDPCQPSRERTVAPTTIAGTSSTTGSGTAVAPSLLRDERRSSRACAESSRRASVKAGAREQFAGSIDLGLYFGKRSLCLFARL